MEQQSIGLIGLGNAGGPIGERLVKKGFRLKVYDLNEKAIEVIVKVGATAATSPADAVSDITFMAVPGSIEVRQAAFGPKGVLEAMKPGQILIDISGTDPQCARELQEKVIAKGCGFLGGTIHADSAPAATIPKGLLSLVMGGDRATFDKCTGPLKALAQTVIYVPEPNIPKAIKIAVIMLATANTIMLAEICSWLEAQDIDPKLFLRVQQINGSDGAGRIEHFFKREKSYGGALSNSYKDLHQALQTAPDLGVPLSLPFTALAHQIQEMGRTKGLTRFNSPAAIGKLYEDLNGRSLSRATVEKNERTFDEPHEPEIIYL
jgi:3-hydroxyisobutyrate dehydrogenase-like beta-hydroxyacid dehydrogenase